eukprot:749731-Hanusia_phi.AAC.1
MARRQDHTWESQSESKKETPLSGRRVRSPPGPGGPDRGRRRRAALFKARRYIALFAKHTCDGGPIEGARREERVRGREQEAVKQTDSHLDTREECSIKLGES